MKSNNNTYQLLAIMSGGFIAAAGFGIAGDAPKLGDLPASVQATFKKTKKLPAAVREAIEKALPGGEIEQVEQVTAGKDKFYEVIVEAKEGEFELKVSASGEILEKELCKEEDDDDVILLDIMLPGLDGLSLLRQLREAGSSTHIRFR